MYIDDVWRDELNGYLYERVFCSKWLLNYLSGETQMTTKWYVI